MTPVGARCKDCGTNRSSHIFQITPLQALVALGVSLALGALGAFIASLGVIGLFAVFYAPAAGNLAGRAVVKATKGKRGTKLAMVSIAGFVLGALGFTLIVSGSLLNPWLWAFVGLSAAGAWYWIK